MFSIAMLLRSPRHGDDGLVDLGEARDVKA
jgi:hypothetical protein